MLTFWVFKSSEKGFLNGKIIVAQNRLIITTLICIFSKTKDPVVYLCQSAEALAAKFWQTV
jgi:hypothetical protein